MDGIKNNIVVNDKGIHSNRSSKVIDDQVIRHYADLSAQAGSNVRTPSRFFQVVNNNGDTKYVIFSTITMVDSVVGVKSIDIYRKLSQSPIMDILNDFHEHPDEYPRYTGKTLNLKADYEVYQFPFGSTSQYLTYYIAYVYKVTFGDDHVIYLPLYCLPLPV